MRTMPGSSGRTAKRRRRNGPALDTHDALFQAGPPAVRVPVHIVPRDVETRPPVPAEPEFKPMRRPSPPVTPAPFRDWLPAARIAAPRAGDESPLN